MNFQAAGDLTGAQNALDAFGPATDIQAYTQLYLQLYAGFKTNDTLTADERAELTAMTRLCPFIYGPVIYQSRSLYNMINRSAELYDDTECESGTGSRRAHFPVSEILNKELFNVKGYRLFPNPAIDELTVISGKETEVVTIYIRDVNDRLLLKKTLTISDYKSLLKFDLLNGIYFVSLVNEEHAQIIKKLVIAK